MEDSDIQVSILWSRPVRVRVGYGFPEIIRGPREALEYLKWRWPVRDGFYYVQALKECAASPQRLRSLEKARQAFILASIEAKMLGQPDRQEYFGLTEYLRSPLGHSLKRPV